MKFACFLGLRGYDLDWINERLKDIFYKKIEWAKINHERYKIFEDKQRKN